MDPATTMVVVRLVNVVFDMINILIIIRIVLSWIGTDPSSPAIRVIYQLSEPLLAPFRNLIPARAAGLDFSPLVAVIVYNVLRRLIVNLLV